MKELTYTGWKVWEPTDEEFAEMFVTNRVPFQMKENEYLIVHDTQGCSTFYCYENGKFRNFRGGSIKTFSVEQGDNGDAFVQNKKSKAKKCSSGGKTSAIVPRNDEQTCAFDLIKDERKTVKVLLGAFGAGKDLIMATAALELLNKGKYEKIIWIRNPITLKDTPDLGSLPGDIISKLLPYLGPFIDATSEASVKTMLTKGSLEVQPLQALRGRNFENSILICSEAQNLTYDHLKLIVARVAEGSCLFINGDIRQRDKSSFEKSQGLEKFIECLTGEPLFGYVYLPRTERSATARLADKLDRFGIQTESQ